MKKKINYGGIPDKVLDLVIGECYGLGDYTLRYELEKYGEDIILAQYNLKTHESRACEYLEWFRAWTKTYTMCLVQSGFGDEIILGLHREVPNGTEIKLGVVSERRKEKTRRTKRTNSKTTKR